MSVYGRRRSFSTGLKILSKKPLRVLGEFTTCTDEITHGSVEFWSICIPN